MRWDHKETYRGEGNRRRESLLSNDGEMPERDQGHEYGSTVPTLKSISIVTLRTSSRCPPDCIQEDFNGVVLSLILELTSANLHNPLFEAALPSHELYHPDSSKDFIRQGGPFVACFPELLLDALESG